MEELKFRAWITDSETKQKRMSQTFGMFDLQGDFLCTDNVSLKDCPIMQYTGIKDMDGVEIYNGDIVERNSGDSYLVSYGEGSFECYHRFTGIILLDSTMEENYDDMSTGKEQAEKWKVIGNIYQTPELLKEND